MPVRLTIDDFKLLRAVCEIRYANAYLVYDRTGQILHDLRDAFTNLNVASAAPEQTAFVADEGNFGLELTKCHFVADAPNPKLEIFALQCNAFFDVVATRLEIKVFARIGLRTIWRKDFKSNEELRDAMTSIDLLDLKPGPRFGVSNGPTEVSVRWQDKELGTIVRLQMDVSEIDVQLPSELRQAADEPIHKKIIGLSIDADYYTVAPVERSQWAPAEWLPQKIRLIRKESDKILQGDRK